MATGKLFQTKIFNRSGVLVATVDDASLGSFDWAINGGLGELQLTFARRIDDFGEGSQIDLGNKVQIRVFDRETPSQGLLIYQGYIDRYNMNLTPGSESIQVRCVGFQSKLAFLIHKNGTATTVSYSGQDVRYMVEDAIAKAGSNTVITAPSSKLENTGVTPSYTFRNNTIKEVLDKCIDLAPDGFYWLTDANNELTFANADYIKVDNVLDFKKHISEIQVEKTIGSLVNVVYFIGGGNPNLYQKYSRSSSVTEYGTYEKRISDERVTVTGTASQYANTELDKHDHPTVSIRLTIMDSNIAGNPESGFDIEKLRPGQTFRIEGLVDPKDSLWDQMIWDIDFWDFNFAGSLGNTLVINKLSYQYDRVVIECGEFQQSFVRDFRSVEDRLGTSQYENLPSSPS